MKYESKNNLGFILLFISGLIVIAALLLLPQPWVTLAIVLAVAMAGSGFYLMTRAFTSVDRNHPDYKQYRQRFYGEETSPDDPSELR